jgi:hypothetical protein
LLRINDSNAHLGRPLEGPFHPYLPQFPNLRLRSIFVVYSAYATRS